MSKQLLERAFDAMLNGKESKSEKLIRKFMKKHAKKAEKESSKMIRIDGYDNKVVLDVALIGGAIVNGSVLRILGKNGSEIVSVEFPDDYEADSWFQSIEMRKGGTDVADDEESDDLDDGCDDVGTDAWDYDANPEWLSTFKNAPRKDGFYIVRYNSANPTDYDVVMGSNWDSHTYSTLRFAEYWTAPFPSSDDAYAVVNMLSS